jgi:hypothetical protein
MKSKRSVLCYVLFLLSAAILVACIADLREEGGTGGEADHPFEADVSTAAIEEHGASILSRPVSGITEEEAGGTSPLREAEMAASEDTGGGWDVSRAEVGAAASSDVAMPAASDPLETESAVSAPGLTLNQGSRLTAGEVDDNAGWDDYLLYLRNYSGAAVLRLDVTERHQIWVRDNQGEPVLGARIGVEANGQEVAVLRTHSDGRAFFFPRTLDGMAKTYDINVTVNQTSERFAIPSGSAQREWFITHPGASQRPAEARLDLLFLIDATGSMADEINQLKENIRAISSQIDALPSQPDVRFGMVSYRDRGDEYVARVSDFTPDVEEFDRELALVFADGGGDYPEDLNEALSRAVHEPEWRVDDTVSLIFLVADAPPHLDYDQTNHYAVEVMEAAERGIKIYPIASSGLDAQGEYVFRQLAQVSGGRFIFLTYGADGPGSSGTETSFDVSDYTVSSLDSLVVKIVEQELSFLSQ